ncbi:site-specific integrase [Polaromonas aquatica]|uniref:Site-specific integrase n=1 Tax=Polaromonas aquatica TaxID=332657 RepID=A0ABW1TUE0_9BURK
MSKLLLKDALAKYTDRISSQKKGQIQEQYRANTIRRYPLALKPIDEITTVDIADYRDLRLKTIFGKDGKSISPSTVRLELSLLSDVFTIAEIEWGACSGNPVTKVRKPKIPPGRQRRLERYEEKRILRYCALTKNHLVAAIVSFGLETAMRRGEILGLLWEHVDLQSRVAHLPDTKNGSKRDVPLSLAAVRILNSLGPMRTGLVFDCNVNRFKSAWRLIMQKTRIVDLRFHDLRHEAISRLFELGTLDMMEIAAISGHKSLQMLKRYTHLRARMLVSKLDGGKNFHRGVRAVMQIFMPYPASVRNEGDRFHLSFLDFTDIQVDHEEMQEAVALASNALLRRLAALMKDCRIPPRPNMTVDEEGEDFMLISPV